jgi:hypothetical protein
MSGAAVEDVGVIKSDIEKARLEIEQQKLALESRKLRWTSMSFAIPILAVAVILAAGIYLWLEQTKLTLRMDATRLIMAADTDATQAARATYLRQNFGDQIGPVDAFVSSSNTAKWQFMQLIAQRGLAPDEAASLWHLLYPDDDKWNTKELMDLLSKASSRSRTPPASDLPWPPPPPAIDYKPISTPVVDP